MKNSAYPGRIGLRLPSETVRRLYESERQTGKSRSEVVRDVIEAGLTLMEEQYGSRRRSESRPVRRLRKDGVQG
jgi:predicted DNA-binding protein